MVTPSLPPAGTAGTTVFISRQIESLMELGIEVDLIEIRGESRLKYLRAARRVKEQARRSDLVHAHYGFHGWIARSQLHPTSCRIVSRKRPHLLSRGQQANELLPQSRDAVEPPVGRLGRRGHREIRRNGLHRTIRPTTNHPERRGSPEHSHRNHGHRRDVISDGHGIACESFFRGTRIKFGRIILSREQPSKKHRGGSANR